MMVARDSAGQVQGPGKNVWDYALVTPLEPGVAHLRAPLPGVNDVAPRCAELIWPLPAGYGLYEGKLRIKGIGPGLCAAFGLWGRREADELENRFTEEEFSAEFNFDGTPLQFVKHDAYRGNKIPAGQVQRFKGVNFRRTLHYRIDWRLGELRFTVWDNHGGRWEATFPSAPAGVQCFRFWLWRQDGHEAERDASMVTWFSFTPHAVGASADVG